MVACRRVLIRNRKAVVTVVVVADLKINIDKK